MRLRPDPARPLATSTEHAKSALDPGRDAARIMKIVGARSFVYQPADAPVRRRTLTWSRIDRDGRRSAERIRVNRHVNNGHPAA